MAVKLKGEDLSGRTSFTTATVCDNLSALEKTPQVWLLLYHHTMRVKTCILMPCPGRGRGIAGRGAWLVRLQGVIDRVFRNIFKVEVRVVTPLHRNSAWPCNMTERGRAYCISLFQSLWASTATRHNPCGCALSYLRKCGERGGGGESIASLVAGAEGRRGCDIAAFTR
ncbi:hypothetical protein CC78DRAFT_100655 [Lojkania enalia]|uniref:Uncharacterized protein n=1 Tax=Lojkania enalia TaxID=147567 RepID=A0A9P4N647_9PLEO|nr:hypothetical protein CC78DRAFT_100655 [Didymosphaeria enalia]